MTPLKSSTPYKSTKTPFTFGSNASGVLITPEQFAETLCNDLDLNPIRFVPSIVGAIRQQRFEIDPSYMYSHINIKLNLIIGFVTLSDQFEWDMNNKKNSQADNFAGKLCMEVSLSGEFVISAAYFINGYIFWNHETMAYTEESVPIVEIPFKALKEVDQWSNSLDILTDTQLEKQQCAKI